MSFRHILSAVALVLAVTVTALAAPSVTVQLTNGQRYYGSLAFRGNMVVLTNNGQQQQWPVGEVAALEFAPGIPGEQELTSLPGGSGAGLFGRTGNSVVAVMRNGQEVSGRLTGISGDAEQFMLQTSTGTDRISANDLARLYLNPAQAQAAYAASGQGPAGIGTSGRARERGVVPFGGGQQGVLGQQEGSFRVDANTGWTPTGITVRRGEQLVFQASGEISWRKSPRIETAGPAGAPFDAEARRHNYPVPNAGVGALIGRVDNGRPFLIGAGGQTITIPADGQLFLGINDDILVDNSGSFVVRIARAR